MTQLTEFPLASGGSLLVEVRHTGGAVTRGHAPGLIEHAQQTFEQSIGRAKPAVESLISQFRSTSELPEEVKIEFGLDLHAEAGAFIAAASTTANFLVTMTWRRNRR